MVEPSPGPFMDLLIEYGNCDRIQLVCAAIAPIFGLLQFHHSESGVGTSNEAHYQKWRDKAQFDGKFYAGAVTLGSVLRQFGSNFDFVNIDIEGGSAELFDCIMRKQPTLRPKCFCVEHDGRQADLASVALVAGYEHRHINGENIIFERVSDGH